jgi:hypothetical protein
MLSIQRYPSANRAVSITLHDIPRSRHYLQVRHLDIVTSSNDTERLIPGSPWGEQIVGGPQIIADDDPPSVEVQLIREQGNDGVV